MGFRYNFYPRPPRGGRRLMKSNNKAFLVFLSTPSARRATAGSPKTRTGFRFLSTPSARRATSTPSASGSATAYFYPRPPRGGRRNLHLRQRNGRHISIHALREEGDRRGRLCMGTSGYFYPRPPRGGRQIGSRSLTRADLFLSTPSARRATPPH